MKTLKITISGDALFDIMDGIEEVRRLVGEEYTEGFKRRDTGNYKFKLSDPGDANVRINRY